MYSLYISIGVAFGLMTLPTLFGIGWVWTILPGLIAGVFTFAMVSRKYARLIESLSHKANAEVQSAQMLAQRGGSGAQKMMEIKFESAINILKQGFAYEKWQVGASTQINAQIGMLLFSVRALQPKGKLTEVTPYLEKAFVRGPQSRLLQQMWPAWLRLAVCYFKEQKTEKVFEVMQQIENVAAKEGLPWVVHAWFYCKINQRDKAIDVLARGAEASEDPQVAENLSLLQNGKNLKMTGYADQWYSLGLEKSKAMMAGGANMGHPRMKASKGRRR